MIGHRELSNVLENNFKGFLNQKALNNLNIQDLTSLKSFYLEKTSMDLHQRIYLSCSLLRRGGVRI